MNEQQAKVASQLIQRKELWVAADWWTRQLCGDFVNDAGDFMINAVANWAGSKLDTPSQRQVEWFRMALLALMAAKFSDDCWKEDNPNWGSGLRVLSVDYGPDHLLASALAFSGLSGGTLRLPIKTCMWVNPKTVRVRPGYGGKEIELYKEDS